MNRMKIAYVLISTLRQGGATKSFLTLLKGAVEAGIQPLVVVPNKDGTYHDLLAMGVEVLVLDYRPAVYPWLKNFVDYLKFIPRLIGRIMVNRKAVRLLTTSLKEHGTDIVHTNVSVIDVGYRAAMKLGLPHIYHIREYGDKDFGMYYYPSKCIFLKHLQNSKCYSICITKGIQQHHSQQFCERSHVIYNGIFPSQSQKPSHNQGHYFLFAGRIEAAKGLDILLQAYTAYTSLTPMPLPLYLAGEVFDKHLQKKIESDSYKNGTHDNIHFLGPRTDIEDLMRHAHAVVITSPFEAFGRCMPEAMSVGCLTIARNSGGTLEQLENGFLTVGEDIALRFDTAEQLSRQLLYAAQISETEYEHITTKAWKTVNSLYCIDKYVQNVLAVYQEALNPSKTSNN